MKNERINGNFVAGIKKKKSISFHFPRTFAVGELRVFYKKKKKKSMFIGLGDPIEPDTRRTRRARNRNALRTNRVPGGINYAPESSAGESRECADA